MKKPLTIALFTGAVLTLALGVRLGMADEGGVSFWLPGQYGSFAAVPGEPGWSMGTVYYHTSVDAGANRSFQRGGRLEAGIDADVDLLLLAPTFTFAEPFLGGQAAVSLVGIYGKNTTSADLALRGPGGAILSGSTTDSVHGFGDLYPTATLKWNEGVNNYMTYVTGDIPVGKYDADDLANLGIGHGAIDGGLGYTYLDPAKGHEFSIVGGLTYNFENPDTNYQNGIDGHIDWAASQFVSETVHVGLSGYAFQQLTGDSGGILGEFESRVFGITDIIYI
jgi:hypothetical protein